MKSPPPSGLIADFPRVLPFMQYQPRSSNAAKAQSNWEKKSQYLLTEIVKYDSYIDSLQAAMSLRLKKRGEKALEKAQEEVDAVRISQQTQQMALLEELNSVQTENTNLRAQLRKK